MSIELNGGSLFPPIGQLGYLLTLPPYGFYRFRPPTGRAGLPFR
jgi:maltose alpha-D-glucosyltransferase/alpha-amylase